MSEIPLLFRTLVALGVLFFWVFVLISYSREYFVCDLSQHFLGWLRNRSLTPTEVERLRQRSVIGANIIFGYAFVSALIDIRLLLALPIVAIVAIVASKYWISDSLKDDKRNENL